MIISRSIHVAINGTISFFLWLSSIPLCIYTTPYLSIHLSNGQKLLPCLAVVNSAAVNIGVHVCFQIRVFIFSRYMPRSGISESCDNSVFSFLRNLRQEPTIWCLQEIPFRAKDVRAKLFQLCPTLCDPMDAACQASLSVGFSRQEYCSGLPCPPPGDLPRPEIKPASLMSPTLAGWFFTTSTIHTD